MIRENWRVIALVVLLVLSAIALFVPGIGLGPRTEGPTNLQYGLDLSGGTRLEAPIVGMTATDVDLSGRTPSDVNAEVAERLEGVSQGDVQTRLDEGTVEVFVENVTQEEFASALQAAGFDVTAADVEDGVTAATRTEVMNTIEDKIDAAGLAGRSVYQSSTPDGEFFVVIEVPNRNRTEVRSLVETRGVVEVVARYPVQADGGVESRRTTVLTQEQIAQVGPVQEPTAQTPQPSVPVTLTEAGARRFASVMRQYGFTSPQGTDACIQQMNHTRQYCIETFVDGELVYNASMSGGPDGLAVTIESGDFVQSRSFVITAPNRSEARELRIHLRAGALTAPLDFDAGQSSFVEPSLAESFKLYSLITGVVAVLAVAGVVFFRYRDRTIAAPMVVTALSEVVILLGFIAAAGIALDLSHMAGLIAVIGTGVDDLIIIADEVLAEGEVGSGRVFQSRFRKAFWVIGAAAATTVVAMGPLAYLPLGDLQGFAIVTILGVLIGVVITRPAYGDILRLLTSRR